MQALTEKKGYIGDRMDTDIIAGIESEIESALVLSGITREQDLALFPYQPDHVLDKAADIMTASCPS